MADQPSELLEAVYTRLGYASGALHRVVAAPDVQRDSVDEWVERGDWLALAERVGADRVFFVKQDPCVVFAELPALEEDAFREAYRRAWCMARPQCLFLAAPGELRVYSLGKPPARTLDEWQQVQPLALLNKAAEVAETLKSFERAQVESGQLFEEAHFGSPAGRADQRLIADLKALRCALLDRGLEPRHAHALIGRAIFIRYLEDRGVLNRAYFRRVAERSERWQRLLDSPLERPDFAVASGERYFDRILVDKGFTYALFEQLAEDFNGDMFPRDATEHSRVRAEHLHLLRRFLLGDVATGEYSLFFWAYDFSIIPIELISSIYEEFYHETNPGEDEKGTHYTPSRLVDDVLARTLTPAVLNRNPRVLDPACGSGIFLVEAFKRIVRYKAYVAGRRLTPRELRDVLRTQVAGVELNSEAVRVAAFSLYLALLNYQDPPTISANRRLPNLVFEGETGSAQHLNILACGNAFAPTVDERDELTARLNGARTFAGRKSMARYLARSETLPFERGSFDVVIGNPPWEEARTKRKENRTRKIERREVDNPEQGELALGWATAFGLPVGDRSYSQLFIHRSLSLLKEGGKLSLLVHASVLFNQRQTSLDFRQMLLRAYTVEEVVNFSHVRRLYFDHAVAPFVLLRVACQEPQIASHRVVYSAARLTKLAAQLRTGVLSAADRRLIPQAQLLARDYLWKTYTWGSHRDAALMLALDEEMPLRALLGGIDNATGYGFQRGIIKPSAKLRALRTLSSTELKWYGPLLDAYFEGPPSGVSRAPSEALYSGRRMIATRGVKGDLGVCTRLETEPFSFRHTIFCIRLQHLEAWQAKVIVGTTWSSLGRYRLFMRSGPWGTWHDQLVAEDWLEFPVRLPDKLAGPAQAIVRAVDEICSRDNVERRLDGEREARAPSHEVMRMLDEGVFDLFELSKSERNLVTDWSNYSYDLLRNGAGSFAAGRLPSFGSQLAGEVEAVESIAPEHAEFRRYLGAFVSEWAKVMDNPAALRWRIVAPPGAAFLAVILSTEEDAKELSAGQDEREWKAVLERCSRAVGYDASAAVYIDGIIRVVTDSFVVVAKRNERRLWTASAAREDAEATLLQALRLEATMEVG